MQLIFNIAISMLTALTMTSTQDANGHVKGEVWYRPFIEKQNAFNNSTLPNCEITFRSKSLQRKVVTDSGDGSYELDLPAGTYGATTICGTKGSSVLEFYSVGRAEFEVKPNSSIMINLMVLIKRAKKPPEPEYHRKDLGREFLTVKTEALEARKILVRYTRRLAFKNLAEYQGKRDYRQDGPVSVTHGVVAIYADAITVEKPLMHFRAVGHVIVEDGVQRRTGTEATIEFDAPDPIATLKIIN